MSDAILPWVACGSCLVMGLVAVVLRPKTAASWCFFIGMLLLAAEALMDQAVAVSQSAGIAELRLLRSMWVKSLIPVFWLGFSLTYARGNAAEFLRRWKWGLGAALIVPMVLAMGAAGRALAISSADSADVVRFLPPGKMWQMVILVLTLGVLINLEKTFRTAV